MKNLSIQFCKLLFFSALLVGFQGRAQEGPAVFEQEDIQEVERTVKRYFEGLMERDRGKLEQAFSPDARLIGFRGDTYTVTPFETWADGVASAPKRENLEAYENRVSGVELHGKMALARAELFWPEIYYYDLLTLLKIEGEWKIVHKSWHELAR
ncbi:MAG: nuclear transport factor 2 family protein [Nitritalea sp.]